MKKNRIEIATLPRCFCTNPLDFSKTRTDKMYLNVDCKSQNIITMCYSPT